MHPIIDVGDSCIFQGGFLAARNLISLVTHKIKLLINCTDNLPFPPWARDPGTPEVQAFAICGRRVHSAMRSDGEILPLLEPLFDQIQFRQIHG